MGLLDQRIGRLLVITIVITAPIVLMHYQRLPPIPALEYSIQDYFLLKQKPVPPNPDLLFFGIDQDSYEDQVSDEERAAVPELKMLSERFPWNRAVWAGLIDRLAAAGAKVIALDVLLTAPGPGDDELIRSLQKNRDRAVLAWNISEKGEEKSFRFQIPGHLIPDSKGSVVNDDRLGFVNIWEDEDTAIRRARFQLSGRELWQMVADREVSIKTDELSESFAARILRKMGRADAIPRGSSLHRFRYAGPPGTFKPRSVYEIFVPSFWKSNFKNGKFFEGKVVVVGPSINVLHDLHRTPYSTRMLGPEVHLNIVNAALSGAFIEERPIADFLLILLIVAFVLALFVLFHHAIWRSLLTIAVGALYFGGAYLGFTRWNVMYATAAPLLVLNFNSFGMLTYDFVREQLEKLRFRRTLERYLSRDVAREVLDNKESFLQTLGGVRKPVTILFSDVRGFTTRTESADPHQLVQQLNEYFHEMVRIIETHRGRTDKFIGDAVMADWGSIITNGPADDARRAVEAALDMKQTLARLNREWKYRGIPEFAIGIGLNHGDVITGNLGSEEKMEVSVIGDAVNLASRLEGLTKKYHLDLIIGESVAALAGEHFVLRSVDYVRVVGKTRPVAIFTVLGKKGAADAVPAWLPVYEAGMASYRARKFEEAAGHFKRVLDLVPGDSLAAEFLTRCERLRESPPGPDWDGSYTFKEK